MNLFFDAGNTIIFPDRTRTLAPLLGRGIEPSQEQLWSAERVARHRRDAAAAAGGNQKLGDADYWTIFYIQLFSELSTVIGESAAAKLSSDNKLLDALVSATRISANWDLIQPGTREALLNLHQNHKLAILSNSDGHMQDLIARVGLADCFDRVFDSGNMGVEKPDPKIFRMAAEELGVSPADSIYIGDVYSIDYLGARSAGFDAILFDVCGAYRDKGLPRVESLAELRERLSA